MSGGKRPGAGRKKNVPNRASASRERTAEASGITPREVMLESMRVLWSIAHESKNDKKAFERYIRLADSVAKDAAPYFHPRLATVDPEAAARPQKVVVTVIGGLPVGSTPERPEGTEYSEVAPEERY